MPLARETFPTHRLRFLPIDFAGRVETISLLLLHNVLNMSKLNWKNPIVAVPGVDTRGLLSMISEGIEPSTFSVLTKCDNRYTMKPCETHGRPWVVTRRAGPNTYSVTYSVTYLVTHSTITSTTLKTLHGHYSQAGVPLTHQMIDSTVHCAIPIQHISRVCTTYVNSHELPQRYKVLTFCWSDTPEFHFEPMGSTFS